MNDSQAKRIASDNDAQEYAAAAPEVTKDQTTSDAKATWGKISPIQSPEYCCAQDLVSTGPRGSRAQLSLIREKVMSNGSDLHVVARHRRTRDRPWIEGMIMPRLVHEGRSVTLHLSATWSGLEHHRIVRIYFDPNRKVLKYCTPDGQDIPGLEVPWAHLVRYRQPILQLAHSDGLIDAVPGEEGGH